MAAYNQRKALWAIFLGSLKSILRSPQTIVFSLVFPLIFVFIFGAFGGGSGANFKIGLSPTCDTNNVLFDSIAHYPFFTIKQFLNTENGHQDTAKMRSELEKGNLTAILNISKIQKDSIPHFILKLISTSASGAEFGQAISLFENISQKVKKGFYQKNEEIATIIPSVYNVREFHAIDFVLPGQIGFSLLFSTLFGIAFTFYNLREQLVLKRFYATPVNKLNILLGIGFSRLLFQLINVIVLVIVGHFALNFTLAHGFLTFVEILILSIILLTLLMGVGLIFSSIVKSDSTIPLIINLFCLPQMMLSGTFFSTEIFPKWVQNCCQIFPLTHFNVAMRKISFSGAHLTDCIPQLGILFLWIIIIYFIVYKIFKWE